MISVFYELDSYILFRRKSDFKRLISLSKKIIVLNAFSRTCAQYYVNVFSVQLCTSTTENLIKSILFTAF
jgi:hypothetical protein